MAATHAVPRNPAARRPPVVPRESPAGFRCVLDEQPSFLVPQRLLAPRHARGGKTPLLVNPHVWFSWSGPAPAEIVPWLGLTADVPPDWGAAWVSDPVTGSLLPFHLMPATRAVLERAAPGSLAPAGIDARLLDLLRDARILISPAAQKKRQAAWDAAIERASRQFQLGYAPLAGLIHPFHIAALRRHFRRQIRTGALKFGDEQSPLRHVVHNEPVARFFHHQLAPAFSRVAGVSLKPSYVYSASYQGAAQLERHRDRPQCDFSITFCLDYTPEPDGATHWPILLDAPAGRVTVYQAIGDALLYRGCRLPHYRHPLWKDATSTSMFFHYVRHDFRGKLN